MKELEQPPCTPPSPPRCSPVHWHAPSAAFALAIIQIDPLLVSKNMTDTFVEIATLAETMYAALKLPVACFMGALVIAQDLLKPKSNGFNPVRSTWGWHLAVVVSMSLACKVLFDDRFFIAEFLTITDYSLDTLKNAERDAFETLSDGKGRCVSLLTARVDDFRVAMLHVLLRQVLPANVTKILPLTTTLTLTLTLTLTIT
jgi:hypothetical protein